MPHACYENLENLVTDIVNDDGVTYEQAVETIRDALDDLYGVEGRVRFKAQEGE